MFILKCRFKTIRSSVYLFLKFSDFASNWSDTVTALNSHVESLQKDFGALLDSIRDADSQEALRDAQETVMARNPQEDLHGLKETIKLCQENSESVKRELQRYRGVFGS